jgi:D-glycero-D-manno-heptose 1,7-bisphosphate phosphatase
MKITPILFVDLDGTIRHGKDQLGRFVNSADDVVIFDGVVDILKSYKERGWRIVAISNQGGVAMGLLTMEGVDSAMQATRQQCSHLFDEMYWCSHHPDAVADDFNSRLEKSVCFCRKPRIGLVVVAFAAMTLKHGENYRPYECLFVGDRTEDRECALNANIPFVWAHNWRNSGPLTT